MDNFDKKITASQLSSDLVKYFDGLNSVTDTNNVDQKASAIIVKVKTKKKTTFFEGKIDTYDHFATNKRFILNVKVESNYCEESKKTIILFKFSPKKYTHKVWETLNDIELKKEYCN